MHQLKDKILKKNSILLLMPEKPRTELLSAVFGFGLALEKLGKKVHVLSNENKNHSFLHKPKNISQEADNIGEVFVSIDTTDKKIKEMRYEKLDNELRIYLTPHEEDSHKKSITTTKPIKNPYDLVIVFEAKEPRDLGNFYNKNKYLFEDNNSIIFINRNLYYEFVYDFLDHLKIDLDERIEKNLLSSFLLRNSFYLKNNLILSRIENSQTEKLGVSSIELISAIINIKQHVAKKDDLVALIEPPKKNIKEFGILGMLISEDREKLSLFSKIFKTKIKGDYVLFFMKMQDLKKAELEILKILNTL